MNFFSCSLTNELCFQVYDSWYIVVQEGPSTQRERSWAQQEAKLKQNTSAECTKAYITQHDNRKEIGLYSCNNAYHQIEQQTKTASSHPFLRKSSFPIVNFKFSEKARFELSSLWKYGTLFAHVTGGTDRDTSTWDILQRYCNFMFHWRACLDGTVACEQGNPAMLMRYACYNPSMDPLQRPGHKSRSDLQRSKLWQTLSANWAVKHKPPWQAQCKSSCLTEM